MQARPPVRRNVTPLGNLSRATNRELERELRNNIPGYKPRAEIRGSNASGNQVTSEVLRNEIVNARLIGYGNFNNQTRSGEQSNFQLALGTTQFVRQSSPGTFQFNGQGGAQGAQNFFNSLNPQNVRSLPNTRSGGTKPGLLGTLNFGSNTSATINIRPNDQGTRVDIKITTQRAGSRIRTTTEVKIQFREEQGN